MDLAKAVVKEPWFKRLEMRASTTFQIMEHLDKFDRGIIVETGCAWDIDNWNGQGQSTLIWDWVLERKPNFNCISIDITPEHIEKAKAQVKYVTFRCGDSLKMLSQMEAILWNCRLLYLDSFDWADQLNFDSAFHHMAELTCVWRVLPSGCMIVVDDRHGALRGKHWLVEGFFTKLGIDPVFCDYQIGWIKP